jgi:hypothetical protein
LEVTDEVIEIDIQLEASEIVAFIAKRVSNR